jgi:hypothetical protein
MGISDGINLELGLNAHPIRIPCPPLVKIYWQHISIPHYTLASSRIENENRIYASKSDHVNTEMRKDISPSRIKIDDYALV